MRQQAKRTNHGRFLVGALGICLALSAIGCQVDMNGQTLPSGYYLTDDIQYFPPGPEFKLSKEAAAQKAFREEQALQAGP